MTGREPLVSRSDPGEGLSRESAADDNDRDRAPSWRRFRGPLWTLSGVLLVVTAVTTFVASQRAGTRSLSVKGGGAAKPFELENVRLGAPPVSLAEYRGSPVVVNFFASWCVPCRHEMASFERVWERLGGRVRFIGVAHEDSRQGATQLLDDTGVRYPAGFDPDGKVALSYGLFGIPTTLFISSQGALLERHTGEVTEKQLTEAIERLFPA